MFDKFFKKFKKNTAENKDSKETRDAAKERLHLVLMQDRANVSADFMELMKQEIIEVIKKYIDVDENSIDVKLTNKDNGDGTTGGPILYANIPIVSIKEEQKEVEKEENKDVKVEDNKEEKTEKVEKKEEDSTEIKETVVEEKQEEIEDNNKAEV